MALIISDNGGGTSELMDADSHQAVCTHVVDLKWQETQWGYKHKVGLVFQFDTKMSTGDRFIRSRVYTSSLNSKSALRKDLEIWRGRAFTPEELAGFDLEKLIGVNAFISIIHEEKEGKKYDRIAAITKVPKGIPTIKADDNAQVPKWLQDMQAKGKLENPEQAGALQDSPPITDADIPQDDLPF